MNYDEARRQAYEAIVEELEYVGADGYAEEDMIMVGCNGQKIIAYSYFSEEGRSHALQSIGSDDYEEYNIMDKKFFNEDGEIDSDNVYDIVDQWIFECDFH